MKTYRRFLGIVKVEKQPYGNRASYKTCKFRLLGEFKASLKYDLI